MVVVFFSSYNVIPGSSQHFLAHKLQDNKYVRNNTDNNKQIVTVPYRQWIFIPHAFPVAQTEATSGSKNSKHYSNLNSQHQCTTEFSQAVVAIRQLAKSPPGSHQCARNDSHSHADRGSLLLLQWRERSSFHSPPFYLFWLKLLPPTEMFTHPPPSSRLPVRSIIDCSHDLQQCAHLLTRRLNAAQRVTSSTAAQSANVALITVIITRSCL